MLSPAWWYIDVKMNANKLWRKLESEHGLNFSLIFHIFYWTESNFKSRELQFMEEGATTLIQILWLGFISHENSYINYGGFGRNMSLMLLKQECNCIVLLLFQAQMCAEVQPRTEPQEALCATLVLQATSMETRQLGDMAATWQGTWSLVSRQG